MFRPNLHFEVRRSVNEPQKRQHLTRLLAEIEGTGIVYAATVRQVDLLSDLLAGVGFNVGKDHSRMPAKQRQENQDRFMAGDVHAMVATNAFGTDIDKADIRFVIHYALPGSLEAYYQEAGRAGRDGYPARCALLYRLENRRTQRFFVGGRYPQSEDIRPVYDALANATTGGAAVPMSSLKEAASGVDDTTLRAALQLLKELGVVRERRGATIALLRPDLSAGALDELLGRYKAQHAADHERLNRMLEYARSARCRWKLLLDYFGEEVPWERCEHCDNCRNPLEDQIAPSDARSESADA